MIEANGNGNIIYAAAKWSGKGKDDKGKPKDLSGLATQVFEKRPDGSLKLKLKTFNGMQSLVLTEIKDSYNSIQSSTGNMLSIWTLQRSIMIR